MPDTDTVPTRDPAVYRARLRELRARLDEVSNALARARLAAESRAERIELHYRLTTANYVRENLRRVELEFGGTPDMIPLRTPRAPWSRIDRAIDLLERAISGLVDLPYGASVWAHIGAGAEYGEVFTDWAAA